MFNRRTDLALEARELWKESAEGTSRLPGVRAKRRRAEGYAVTEVEVLDGRGAEALGKPVGRYRTVELTAVSYSTCRRYTYGMTNQDSGYFQNVKTNGYVAKYATVLYEVGHYFTLTGNMYGPITGWINQDRLEPGMSVEFDVILDGEVVNHVVLTSDYNANAHPIMCMVPTSGEHTLTIRVTAMNGIYEFNQWGSNMLCSVLYCYLPR